MVFKIRPAADKIRDFSMPLANGCIVWTGARDKDGYGKSSVNGVDIRAHRLAWIHKNGPIPIGLWVLHRCDNPPCINPDHLYVGDQFQNEDDKRQRGKSPRGESNIKAKLSDIEIIEMREMYETGAYSKAALGRHFHVCKSTSTRIINGKLWKHI